MKLGCHVSNSGKEMLLGAVNEAISYNANCFMVYLGAPQNSYRKDVKDMNIPKYLEALKKHNISNEDIIIHAPYIINLAQTDEEKRRFGVEFISREIITLGIMKAKYLVLHPGSSLDNGLEVGVNQIIKSLKEILDNTLGSDVVICLETMAGKGSEVCYKFEHIRTIIEGVNSDRIKVCLDTCHTFDSGYDWVCKYEEVIKDLDKIIGIENIKVIHLNDSKNILGSKKDRHANIGYGNIGFNTLAKVCHDKRFEFIPKILETPYIENEEGKKVYPPYKHEIKMLRDNEFNQNLIEDIKLQEI